MKPTSIRESALHYLSLGWSVIPVRIRDKRPVISWREYQYHRPSKALVREWFLDKSKVNVGIVTGIVSDLVVVDIDPQHGGEESLAELVEHHEAMPSTVEAVTGGGGRHLYFRHPGGVVPNRVGFRPGMDLRGDGGYVVAPPSIHASGKFYAWRASHEPGSCALAALPDWLWAAIRAGSKSSRHTVEHWRRLARDGVQEGARNTTIASLTGHLLWHGVDDEVAAELIHCWNRVRCRPPLADDEVAQVLRSITQLHRQADGES